MICSPSSGRLRSARDLDGRQGARRSIRIGCHTHLMTSGRLEYVQPYGVRHLANTEGRRGTKREVAAAKKRAAAALEQGRKRAEELRRSHER